MRISPMTLVMTGSALSAIAGCASPTNVPYAQAMVKGEYGQARAVMASSMTAKRSDRNYMLDRLRLGIAALADGVPQAAERPFEEVYSVLRTQGINEGKAIEAVVLNEDLKVWKGEPFEQAMALHYISLYNMEIGDWGAARATSGNSLFQLRDFGATAQGQRLDQEELVRRAAKDDDYLNKGYVETDTNFALGYLMHAVANQNLGRDDEAADNFHKARQVNPDLAELVSRLQARQFNTLMVVDFGPGPRKRGTGPDCAIARFEPLVPSDQRPLLVRVGQDSTSVAQETLTFPAVSDLNVMAQDHMWNNLEDVRVAKSHVGSALLYGGAATTAVSMAYGSDTGSWIGLGMMLAGAVAKAGAHADERFCESMPQRVYLAPIELPPGRSSLELAVDAAAGAPGSRMTLMGLTPPPADQVQVRYVRLVAPGVPSSWAQAGAIVYCNDATGCIDHDPAGRPHVPVILGGYCARTPSEEVLVAYQNSGYLAGLTLGDLEELYRQENIAMGGDAAAEPGQHLLEGGNWLYAPLPGTAGFVRLFGQSHQPYQPRVPQTRAMAQEVARQATERPGAVAWDAGRRGERESVAVVR